MEDADVHTGTDDRFIIPHAIRTLECHSCAEHFFRRQFTSKLHFSCRKHTTDTTHSLCIFPQSCRSVWEDRLAAAESSQSCDLCSKTVLE